MAFLSLSPPPKKRPWRSLWSWWLLLVFSHLSLQPPSEAGEYPTFHLYVCDDIFRSHLVSSSSDPLNRSSLGWGNCTSGECCCRYGFLFPRLALVLWQRYRFSTLFAHLSAVVLKGVVHDLLDSLQHSLFSQRTRCFLSLSRVTQAGSGENPRYVSLGKQLPEP